jgi:GNAT superfamily N-acetyltransferase
VAAPITDHDGYAIAAINISVATTRWTVESAEARLVQQVHVAATSISKARLLHGFWAPSPMNSFSPPLPLPFGVKGRFGWRGRLQTFKLRSSPAPCSQTVVTIEIRPARIPADIPVARDLFRDYAAGLGIDLGFQDFDAELASLPGKYAPPRGRLLLAWDGANAVGCVALRAISDEDCEMKRLFVRPGHRGEQVGHKLAERICSEARAAGYRRMCLDTLSTMSSALWLYSSLGFRPIEPYVFNPIEGAIFLALDLEQYRPAKGW